MRTLAPVILALAAALASAAPPAAAQVALTLQRDNELWAAQQSARQREIATHNESGVLDARVRTDEALRDLDQQRRAAPITTPKDPKAFDPGVFVLMPDSRLAASNARVRAAAGEGR